MTPERSAERELLSRAAQECQRRYAFIDRFEFDRFDRLIWFYREGTVESDRALFVTCYRERVTELTKSTAVSAPSSRPSSPPVALPLDAWKEPPVWKVGDEWSYRWESPRGGGTYVWRVAREEVIEAIDCYVVDGGRYQLYFRKSDLALLLQLDRGTLDLRYLPARQFVAWPLYVGRNWETLYTLEQPRLRTTNNRLRAWRVDAKERITVPAGSFDAFKIVEHDKWSNTVASETWVAPALKGLVRLHLHFDYGVEKRELTAYKLDSPPGRPSASATPPGWAWSRERSQERGHVRTP